MVAAAQAQAQMHWQSGPPANAPTQAIPAQPVAAPPGTAVPGIQGAVDALGSTTSTPARVLSDEWDIFTFVFKYMALK